MKDPRVKKLAAKLLSHSCQLKKGQTLIIEGNESCKYLIIELVNQAYEIGAFPFVRLGNAEISRAVLKGTTEDYAKRLCAYAKPLFEDADAYIGIGASTNVFETSDVAQENKDIQAKFYSKPIHIDIRVMKTNWVILRYPNQSMAQLAQTSTEAFEDFFYDVCTLDYDKMHKAMIPLQNLMAKTDKVRIVAPETDLTFSIKGQVSKICSGECNIPDGEIYTAPIRESVNGKIKFNIPSLWKGVIHSDIRLEFKNGKIISESSSNTSALAHELNADDGARYTGEFAFGVNPFVLKPMYDTLFDEKMAFSIHMAMGNCYDDVPNGNHSQNHWDMVHSHAEQYGGGEIYFDDVLIRKNGRFVLPELDCLNPENLK
ncbi:MAG: aminopeptidase [Christensenellaceae bacterium]|jgi:aminopeptidase|nr:aminopeptidase [Christensenellaceae bacterium]